MPGARREISLDGRDCGEIAVVHLKTGSAIKVVDIVFVHKDKFSSFFCMCVL